MDTSDNYHIIENLELILVSHNNTFTQQNIEKLLAEYDVNPFLAKCAKVLIDMRKANIKVDTDEIIEISKMVFNKLNDSKLKKLAILIDAPQINKVVEFVKAYQQPSKYQVFARMEGALHWLKIPAERKEQVELKLNYLEKY